jgi:positive phototaxis protein PixI
MVSDFASTSENLINSTESNSSEIQEQFLQVSLLPDVTALLPTRPLAEVLSIAAAEITPIPHMSDWMMGVFNWRGEILPLVDLSYLGGLTPLYQKAIASNYTVVVLQTQDSDSKSMESQILGLVVNGVGNIEWCAPDLIQTLPTTLNPQLGKFLRGYYSKPNEEILAVFELDALWKAISE